MDFFVTRATVDGRGLSAVVRSVAGNALRVPVREDGRARNSGFGLSMARGTRRPRFGRWRMLARMAGGTTFHWIFALRRVEGIHILMTRGTGRRLRSFLFMRGVARQAISRTMYFNRRKRPLRLLMAAQTVLGQKGAPVPSEVALRSMSAIRRLSECVATQAVGHHARTILLLGLGTRVVQLRLLLMAARAPFGPHLPDFTLREIVTGHARDFFLQHMDSVTQYIARLLPLFGDINPLTPFLVPHFVGRTAGEEKGENSDGNPDDRAKR